MITLSLWLDVAGKCVGRIATEKASVVKFRRDEIMSKGIFGNMFDLNRDGKLDTLERGLDFALFEHLTNEDEESDEDEEE